MNKITFSKAEWMCSDKYSKHPCSSAIVPARIPILSKINRIVYIYKKENKTVGVCILALT